MQMNNCLPFTNIKDYRADAVIRAVFSLATFFDFYSFFLRFIIDAKLPKLFTCSSFSPWWRQVA